MKEAIEWRLEVTFGVSLVFARVAFGDGFPCERGSHRNGMVFSFWDDSAVRRWRNFAPRCWQVLATNLVRSVVELVGLDCNHLALLNLVARELETAGYLRASFFQGRGKTWDAFGPGFFLLRRIFIMCVIGERKWKCLNLKYVVIKLWSIFGLRNGFVCFFKGFWWEMNTNSLLFYSCWKY